MSATQAISARPASSPTHVLHWVEYACEALGLGVFLFSACVFTALLEHPASSAHQAIESSFVRRMVMGIAMGLTSLGIFYSPVGQRSGAHLNPAVTLAFLLLGKVRPADAMFYIAAQFVGGAAGVLAAMYLTGPALGHSAVKYAITVPGTPGVALAFAAELVISFVLMGAILITSNRRDLKKWTPLCAASLVTLWITVEAPLSGMSMNPARTVASALPAGVWTAWWIYLTAPVLAMGGAAWLYRQRYGTRGVYCAKLNHPLHDSRCIFRCHHSEM